MLTIVGSLYRVVSWAQLYSESIFNFVGFKTKILITVISVAVLIFIYPM